MSFVWVSFLTEEVESSFLHKEIQAELQVQMKKTWCRKKDAVSVVWVRSINTIQDKIMLSVETVGESFRLQEEM